MKNAKHVILAAALCYSTIAAGDQITLQWDPNPLSFTPAAGTYGFYVDSYHSSVAPDRYHGTVTNAVGIDPLTIGDGTGIPEGLYTYCYELTQFFYGGEPVVYQILYGNQPGAVTADTLDFLGGVNSVLGGNYGWLHPTSAKMAAAIQLGIWETLYDAGGAFNLGAGHFHLTSASLTALGSSAGSVGDYLNTFHTAMASAPSLGDQYIVRLSNTDDPRQNHAGAQDQITARIPPPSEQTVPEPASLALVALGVAAAAISRRRSKADRIA